MRNHPRRARISATTFDPSTDGKSDVQLRRESRAGATALFVMICAASACAIRHADSIHVAVPAFAFSCPVYDFTPALMRNSPSSPDFILSAFVATGELAPTYVCAEYGYAVTVTSDLGAIAIPRSYSQARLSPESTYWMAAVAKELAGLASNRTWDLVLLTNVPKGANIMFCHYVFTVKRLRTGEVEKFKARLVANGNTQKYGVDFDHIFSAVVKTLTIRIALVIAAQRDYNLTAIDIRQAYLQADIGGDLYMRVPQGVTDTDGQGRRLVCKLRKSLYGLKQAGRMWAALFADFLVQWGFTRSTIDTCLFTYTHDGKILWALIYVDDALLVDNDSALRDRFVKDLSARFPTEDKGELAWLLGVAIDRDRSARTITLSQRLYVADLIAKYGSFITSARRFDTPFPEGIILTDEGVPVVGSPEYEAMHDRRIIYMQLVGSYLWLANMTNSEILYPSAQLARFLANPSPQHFDLTIRVLTYLRDHSDSALRYAPNGDRGVEVFVDSSWTDRFSCSGAYYLYMGCPVHWFTRTQRSVTLSSAEAEYFGVMLAARDGIFVRDVLSDLGVNFDGPLVYSCDSKSAVDLSRDPIAFKNTKHILVPTRCKLPS